MPFDSPSAAPVGGVVGALWGGGDDGFKRKRTRARNKDKWLRRGILIGQPATGALAVENGRHWHAVNFKTLSNAKKKGEKKVHVPL